MPHFEPQNSSKDNQANGSLKKWIANGNLRNSFVSFISF